MMSLSGLIIVAALIFISYHYDIPPENVHLTWQTWENGTLVNMNDTFYPPDLEGRAFRVGTEFDDLPISEHCLVGLSIVVTDAKLFTARADPFRAIVDETKRRLTSEAAALSRVSSYNSSTFSSIYGADSAVVYVDCKKNETVVASDRGGIAALLFIVFLGLLRHGIFIYDHSYGGPAVFARFDAFHKPYDFKVHHSIGWIFEKRRPIYIHWKWWVSSDGVTIESRRTRFLETDINALIEIDEKTNVLVNLTLENDTDIIAAVTRKDALDVALEMVEAMAKEKIGESSRITFREKIEIDGGPVHEATGFSVHETVVVNHGYTFDKPAPVTADPGE